jgi:tRNA threonylcarbamoyladenosine biosynthesis protein TsaE
MTARRFETHSEEETFRQGETFGRRLRPPAVVLFYGDLGTGKTVFIRGVCRALGVPARLVRSPSFTLVNEYPATAGPVHHVDLYRLEGAAAVESIGLDELLDGGGIVLVEWAERLPDPPPGACRIHLAHLGGERRKIEILAGAELPSGSSVEG